MNVSEKSPVTEDLTNVSSASQSSSAAVVFKYVYYPGGYITSILGIISNILIIITMVRCRKLRSVSAGSLMMALAAVDSVVLIMILLSHIKNVDYGNKCYIIYFIRYSCENFSRLIVMLLCVNRYALICRPFSHQVVTSQTSTMIQLLITGVLSASAPVYVFFTFAKCKVTDMHIYFVLVLVFNIVLFGIIPILLIFILSLKIILTIKGRLMRVNPQNESSSNNNFPQKNLNKALLSVVIAYVILSLPYIIRFIFYYAYNKGLGVKDSNFLVSYYLLFLLYQCNFGINFILYCMFCKPFRQTFVSIKCVSGRT